MARYARQASKTGVYHIMVRGINGKNIFHDDDDYKRYWETLSRISDEGEAQVLGYCLMSNHNMNAKDMCFKIDLKTQEKHKGKHKKNKGTVLLC